jgi:spermidine synthase
MRPRISFVSRRSKHHPATGKQLYTVPVAAVFAAFFLSGMAGLMHQVVWARLLAGLIGNTAHAQAAVLAVFMGGLAIGSVAFGRAADARANPLRLYILLEVLIAAYCLVLPPILYLISGGYVAVAALFVDSLALTATLRMALALIAVLLPAVLMGGTLPILARYLVRDVSQTQRQVASLYALNSFGAVIGAGAAGFITLPLLGLYPSLLLACLLNLAAAVVLRGGISEDSASSDTGGIAPGVIGKKGQKYTQPLYRPDQYAVTLFALALSGFAAMGYEVLFTRVIALSFGSTTYSFSVMLMAFISGIGLGSWIVSRIRVQRPLWLLGLAQLSAVVALLLVTPLISRLPYFVSLLHLYLIDVPLGFELYQFGKAALCLMVLLIPTTCLGFSFPLVAQIQARRNDEIGASVGSTYAWNTTGNVLGALLTSLVLLPQFGLLGAFQFNFALNLIAGVAIFLVAAQVNVYQRVVAVAFSVLVAIVFATEGNGWLQPVIYAHGQFRTIAALDPEADAAARAAHPLSSFESWQDRFVSSEEGDEILFFGEDAHATVLVRDSGEQTVLFVNGKGDASTRHDLPTQILLAQVPMLLAPATDNVLVIGHGSGITAGSALQHPVKNVDIVEISKAVLEADAQFVDHNYGVLSDPRVRTYLEDGQNFMRTAPRNYDVIISEPSNPWMAGNGDLFSEEFFEIMKSRLTQRGLAVVWFQQYSQSRAGVELVLRTLTSSFDQVMVWRSPSYMDIIAVASMAPFEVDFESMEARFDRIEVRNDLARFGLSNLASLLVHQVISPEKLRAVLPPGPVNTTAHQRLQYLAPRTLFSGEGTDFLQSLDPLYQGVTEPSDTLLDQYISFRAASEEPVSVNELVYLARNSRASVRSALAARVTQTTATASRPARGLLSRPQDMKNYEAALWAGRLSQAGRAREASYYQQRALSPNLLER